MLVCMYIPVYMYVCMYVMYMSVSVGIVFICVFVHQGYTQGGLRGFVRTPYFDSTILFLLQNLIMAM